MLEHHLFSHRRAFLLTFFLTTCFLLFSARNLHIDAGFTKQIPLSHPYMQVFLKHSAEFGGANRVLIAVAPQSGDIFTPEFFETLKLASDEVFFLPGVNRSTVRSIFTPNERFVEIVEGGFSGGNIIPADFSPTVSQIQTVRENILKAGAVGRLVANDFSAAMISAQLVENDPATGAKLNYFEVSRHLEERIRTPIEAKGATVHIIGFAKVMGDIADGARDVILFFGISLLCTAVLVYLFTHSLLLTVLPLLSSLVAVIWNLGLVTLLGYGIDPMSILVPFLVFAIAVSHGVQMTNAVGAALAENVPALEAAKSSFRRLLLPGTLALVSDGVGFLTIALIDITMIQELAVTATLGVVVIIFTNLLLLPLMLSYLKLDERYRARAQRSAERKEWLWHLLAGFCLPRRALITVLVALLLAAFGIREALNMRIGDSETGVPELRQDARYNLDARFISSRFSIGVDLFTTIVETSTDGCIDHSVMTTIDEFQWTLSNVEGVRSTLSLPQLAKLLYAGFQEGNPKWLTLPHDPQTLVQAVSPIETSTGLLNSDCSVMPVIAFLEDHRSETIDRVREAVETFAAAHNSDFIKFLPATGNVGVMAATNQVVAAAQLPMLLYVYLAVATLCLISFRSLAATLAIILPLILVSILCSALMSALGIGLKVATLPVAALGVGIGVDYGIYIYGQMRIYLTEGQGIQEAFHNALRTTGNAVLLTGLMLAIGVSTWIFSSLKFQADMGLLLTFMFGANMLGALILLPALTTLLAYGKGVKTRRL